MNENRTGYNANMQRGLTAITARGSGVANSAAIFLNQGAGTYAATICIANNGAGYTDWYLQGNDELNLLYGQKAIVAGFSINYYWRPSEPDLNNTRPGDFINGTETNFGKNTPTYVNPVRSF
jgi:hypothetical protein